MAPVPPLTLRSTEGSTQNCSSGDFVSLNNGKIFINLTAFDRGQRLSSCSSLLCIKPFPLGVRSP